jgi:site-specific DNA recombinase
MNRTNQSETSPPIPGAAYVRYSSEMQSDSFSLDAQLRQIKLRAQMDGVSIIQIFSDPATSAYSKKQRLGIKKMLESGRKGEFRILYIHKVDRLARRLEWALEIVRELQSLDITLKAVEQNFDLSTPEGKLFFHLLSSLGEFYSNNLSKETLKGKRERANQGYHNGSVSWGYFSEKQGNHKMAFRDSETAPIVNSMFERYATGLYSDRQIADWLNTQGCRTLNGRLFGKDSVREMLQNPFYKGYVRYRGTFQRGRPYRGVPGQIVKGAHEPIVREEIWELCQAVRANRRQVVKTRQFTRRFYLVNGIAKCAHCGRNLRAQSSPDIRYYREASRENGFADCPLLGRSIRADLVDQQVEKLILALKLPEDWESAIEEIVRSAQNPSVLDIEVERKRLREELRELREMKRRHLYAGEEHVFWHEVETIQERLAALKQEPSKNVNFSVDTLLSIPFAWAHATQEERRDLVKIILEEVGCDLDAQKIVWVKPQLGYEILFQLIEGLSLMGNNRFDIRDI